MYQNLTTSIILLLTSFAIGILITPIATKQMYKHSLWKKKSAPKTIDGKPSPITAKIYGDNTRNLPRFGGTIVVGAVTLTGILANLAHIAFPAAVSSDFAFLTPSCRTFMPFISFILASSVGLIDDLLVVERLGKYGKALGGGLSTKLRIAFISILAMANGLFAFDRYGLESISVPYLGSINFGVLIVIPFIIVMLALLISGIIDAFDGLSSGIFAMIFSSYGIISFMANQSHLAFFCFVISGALLAHLWFNIPPARFMMSEVGIMGLTAVLGIVAFYSNGVGVLPIIAFPLVATTASTILQLLSKKFRGKKLFIVSPIHNLLVYKFDWSKEKVVMRYWLLSSLCCVAGLLIHVTGVINK